MSAVTGTLKKADGTTNHTGALVTISAADRSQHQVAYSNASTAAFAFDVPNGTYVVQNAVGKSVVTAVSGATALGNL